METGERTKRRRGISCATYLQNLRINCPRPNRDQGKDPKSCVFNFFFFFNLILFSFFYVHSTTTDSAFLLFSLPLLQSLTAHFTASVHLHPSTKKFKTLPVVPVKMSTTRSWHFRTTSSPQYSTPITGPEHQHKIIHKQCVRSDCYHIHHAELHCNHRSWTST